MTSSIQCVPGVVQPSGKPAPLNSHSLSPPCPRPWLLTTSGLYHAPVDLPVLHILCSGMLQNVESLVFDLSHILVLRFIYIVTK